MTTFSKTRKLNSVQYEPERIGRDAAPALAHGSGNSHHRGQTLRRALIEQFLNLKKFAVCGVSRDPKKFGYKVYRSLRAAGYTVYAINPNTDTIDNEPCYPTLDNLPEAVECIVTVTPPEITEETIRLAGRLKIPYLWMQPGSESNAAYNLAQGFAMQIISGGPCIMVEIAEKRKRDAEA